jgi:DNA-binding CsgD family transcriptional regulator
LSTKLPAITTLVDISTGARIAGAAESTNPRACPFMMAAEKRSLCPVPASKRREPAAELQDEGERAKTTRPVTDRQLEILRNVARGQTNREIGETLGISERTVRNHMRAILKRLSSSDRTHAVVTAIGNGWIAIPIEPERSATMPIGMPSTAEVPSGS